MKNKFEEYYRLLTSNIAFYPTLIALFLFGAAVSLVNLESSSFSEFLEGKVTFLFIKDIETSRSILATLIAGIISLTVFSFSMVMLLLSQASSSFSPRLLPGLISDLKNQIVLGVYIGTIAFNIIILINVTTNESNLIINGFSVLIAILLGFLCLALFVFFIHTISNTIQIENILKNLYFTSKKELEIKKNESNSYQWKAKDYTEWYPIRTQKSNFFQGTELEKLKKIGDSLNTSILIDVEIGEFVNTNTVVLKTSSEIKKEEDLKALSQCLIFSDHRVVDNNITTGIEAITEVGIKAMSPGINDPGTAMITINYLSELFRECLMTGELEVIETEGKNKIVSKLYSFEFLIYKTFAAYRQYCKHDFVLLEKLADLFLYLKEQDTCNPSYLSIINQQIEILKEDAIHNLSNNNDRDRVINKLIR